MVWDVIYQGLHGVGLALTGACAAYLLLACAAVLVAKRHAMNVPALTAQAPALTLLKPLCGDEPDLYRCLLSFCLQSYPCFQIVFGVQKASDSALATVRRIVEEFPLLDIAVVVDARLHGTNIKISNLMNMLAAARHDYILISDSDVAVGPTHFQRVMASLSDPNIGLVTCAYRAVPVSGKWSKLAALFIDDWFIPAVRVAALLGSRSFTSGVTIALHRNTLAKIGGFEAIVDRLADDYWLGELTRRLGYRTVLSQVVVETVVAEPSLAELSRHELRWLRTIRVTNPSGYAFLFVSFGPPVAVLGTFLTRGGSVVLGALYVTLAARALLGYLTRHSTDGTPSIWLMLVSDTLIFALWCWSFTSRRVRWREALYEIKADGSTQRVT